MSVRFELPYAVYCNGNTSFPRHLIARGVRFNAKKSQNGSYYSTPIFSFEFSCVECGNVLVIQTNPQTSSYDIVQGAEKPLNDAFISTPSSKQSPFQCLEQRVHLEQKYQSESSRVQQLLEMEDRRTHISPQDVASFRLSLSRKAFLKEKTSLD
ncbi:hypothetical protein RCL1_003954 [Eukaryota sp. TZLM3-RCL]